MPLGIAMPAHFLSSMSVIFTRTMEQAFSTPSMTDYGLADPLLTMAAINDTMSDVMRIPPSDPKSNLRLSTANFLHQCLAKDLAANAVTKYNLMNETGMESIRRPNKIRTVLIYDGLSHRDVVDDLDGYPKDQKISVYYCENALTAIENMIGKSTPEINKQIMRWKKTHNADVNERGGGADLTQQINDFTSIYHLSDISNKELITKLYFLPLLKDIDRQVGALTFQSVVGRSAATRQQAFQWAAGGSSFLTWMWNMMPIIQGLIYAIAPFMAFALGLGIFGVRMIMKYFMIILWTQSWLPLAAIINYFIVSQMDATASVITFSGVSFLALNDLLTETNKNLALAGNLMSMIPMLSMFILTGSSIAFSKLASGAAASSPSETKPVAPEVSNGPSLMMISPPQTMSRNEASHYSGTAQKYLDLTTGLSNQRTSALNEKKAYSKQLDGMRNVAAGETASFVDAAINNLSGGNSTSLNEGTSVGSNNSSDTSWTRGLSDRIIKAVKNYTGYDARASLGLSVGGSGITGTASTGHESGNTTNQEKTRAMDRAQKLALAKNIKADLMSGNSTRIDNAIQKAGQIGLTGDKGDAYNEKYSKMLAAEKTYNEATTAMNSAGTQRKPSESNVAKMMRDRNVSAGDFRKQLLSLNNGRDYAKFSRLIENELNESKYSGMSDDDRERAAVIFAAVNSGDNEAFGMAMTALGLENPGVNPESATQNQGVVPGGYDGFSNFVDGKINQERNTALAGYDKAHSQAQNLHDTAEKTIPTKERIEQKGKDGQEKITEQNREEAQNLIKRRNAALSADNALTTLSDGKPVKDFDGVSIVKTLYPDAPDEAQVAFGNFLNYQNKLLNEGGYLDSGNPPEIGYTFSSGPEYFEVPSKNKPAETLKAEIFKSPEVKQLDAVFGEGFASSFYKGLSDGDKLNDLADDALMKYKPKN